MVFSPYFCMTCFLLFFFLTFCHLLFDKIRYLSHANVVYIGDRKAEELMILLVLTCYIFYIIFIENV